MKWLAIIAHFLTFNYHRIRRCWDEQFNWESHLPRWCWNLMKGGHGFYYFQYFFAFSGVTIADSCRMVPSRHSVILFFSRFKNKVLQSWQRVVINTIWDMLFNLLFSVQRRISVFGNLFGTSTRCLSHSTNIYSRH